MSRTYPADTPHTEDTKNLLLWIMAQRSLSLPFACLLVNISHCIAHEERYI